MTIDQQALANLLQLGGQYLLPIAALLRALYAGTRGRLPEGFWQILLAGVFAGLTAVVDNQQFDPRIIVLEIFGNTAFVTGLSAFIIIYLLRIANYGLIVDAIVGAGLGLVAWLGWVYVLRNDWPWWTLPPAIVAGSVGFIALRFLLRQIGRLVKIATYLLVLGLLAVVVAIGIFVWQTLTQSGA